MIDEAIQKTIPLDWIIPNPKNYNQHSPEQIKAIKASLKRFKQIRPYVVKQQDEQVFMLAAGEGTTMAARELLRENIKKYEHLSKALVVVVPDNWSEAQIRGYMVADNETARMADANEEILFALLQEQQEEGYDLISVGSNDDTLRQMRKAFEEAIEEKQVEKGSLLELLNVTIGEPTHEVAYGDIWTLSGRHTILCTQVFAEWPLWKEYLQGDTTLFMPFAGPLVPISKKAEEYTLVMVQPDTYIAGHILDRYAEIYGESALKKVVPK